jgi:hypothetical protein
MKINIFLDMDGVLTDFDMGVKKRFGLDLKDIANMTIIDSSIKKKQGMMWGYIRKNPTFWENLPLMNDSTILWNYFSTFHPVVLTAAPTTFSFGSDTFNQVAIMKKKWLETHFLFNDDTRFICTLAKNKHFHMIPNEINVLIDDSKKNIDNWNSAGGIGILHIDANNSIKIFNEKFNNL